ncbi:unnamed protein product [Moneuplotes crassus]|uniref:Uncharacterized protein n=1 Tax=Euplotes crassus TaxID=5936 RepID=A0AAD1U554_EUPCR|nr:unnamed protein product [Moneuplotes crassus]
MNINAISASEHEEKTYTYQNFCDFDHKQEDYGPNPNIFIQEKYDNDRSDTQLQYRQSHNKDIENKQTCDGSLLSSNYNENEKLNFLKSTLIIDPDSKRSSGYRSPRFTAEETSSKDYNSSTHGTLTKSNDLHKSKMKKKNSKRILKKNKNYSKFLQSADTTMLYSPDKPPINEAIQSQPVKFIQKKGRTRNRELNLTGSLPLPSQQENIYLYKLSDNQRSFYHTPDHKRYGKEIKKIKKQLKNCKSQINWLIYNRVSQETSTKVMAFRTPVKSKSRNIMSHAQTSFKRKEFNDKISPPSRKIINSLKVNNRISVQRKQPNKSMPGSSLRRPRSKRDLSPQFSTFLKNKHRIPCSLQPVSMKKPKKPTKLSKISPQFLPERCLNNEASVKKSNFYQEKVRFSKKTKSTKFYPYENSALSMSNKTGYKNYMKTPTKVKCSYKKSGKARFTNTIQVPQSKMNRSEDSGSKEENKEFILKLELKNSTPDFAFAVTSDNHSGLNSRTITPQSNTFGNSYIDTDDYFTYISKHPENVEDSDEEENIISKDDGTQPINSLHLRVKSLPKQRS